MLQAGCAQSGCQKPQRSSSWRAQPSQTLWDALPMGHQWVFSMFHQLHGENVDPKPATKKQQGKHFRHALKKSFNLGWTCMQIIGCTGMFAATLSHGICSRVCVYQCRCVCFIQTPRVKIDDWNLQSQNWMRTFTGTPGFSVDKIPTEPIHRRPSLWQESCAGQHQLWHCLQTEKAMILV